MLNAWDHCASEDTVMQPNYVWIQNSKVTLSPHLLRWDFDFIGCGLLLYSLHRCSSFALLPYISVTGYFSHSNVFPVCCSLLLSFCISVGFYRIAAETLSGWWNYPQPGCMFSITSSKQLLQPQCKTVNLYQWVELNCVYYIKLTLLNSGWKKSSTSL